MMNRLICVLLLLLVISDCFTPSKDSDWTIEWHLTTENSMPAFANDSFVISHNLSSTKRNGRIDSLGRLMIGITMPGFDEDVINNNPTLHCVISNGIKIVFDTSYSWNEMDFKEQYSDLYAEVLENVSKKIFYIDPN
jgi:hypothetical protein